MRIGVEAVQEDLYGQRVPLLDDTYVATTPHRVGDVYQSVDENLWAYSRIRIVECNQRPTRVLRHVGGHCLQVRP